MRESTREFVLQHLILLMITPHRTCLTFSFLWKKGKTPEIPQAGLLYLSEKLMWDRMLSHIPDQDYGMHYQLM